MSAVRRTKPEFELLERALERERKARQKAEDLLESMATEIFEANQRLQTQNRELDFLIQVAQVAEREKTTRGAVQAFLKLAVNFLDWPLGHAYFVARENPNQLRSAGVWAGTDLGRFSEFMRVTAETTFMLGEGLPGRVAENGRVEWIENLARDPNFPRARAIRDFNLISAFGAPLSLNGKVSAVFEFFHTNAAGKDPRKSEVIFASLKQLSYLLERKQAQRDLAANYRALSETKDQLIQSEKMASLGVISAGVAHEINNPLSYVISNLETLRTYVGNLAACDIRTPEATEGGSPSVDVDYLMRDMPTLVEETLTGVFRVRDVVHGLKSFSHLDKHKRSTVDLVECVHSALKVLSNEIKYSCGVETRLEALAPIEGYAGQIVQVLVNLILNSVQSMEGRRGKITIRAWADEQGVRRIAVRDDGKGIPASHLKQIFTPFFTTKGPGKGTGLGLSVSYGIIKAHGGTVEVRSEVGVGTEFEIAFGAIKVEDGASRGEEDEW